MGLLREDGSPKLALKQFTDYTPELGICQCFTLKTTARLCSGMAAQTGVKRLRTGLSWADYLRPDADKWFDR
jgi:hypothetical protein